jgi:hypothetical protein
MTTRMLGDLAVIGRGPHFGPVDRRAGAGAPPFFVSGEQFQAYGGLATGKGCGRNIP